MQSHHATDGSPWTAARVNQLFLPFHADMHSYGKNVEINSWNINSQADLYGFVICQLIILVFWGVTRWMETLPVSTPWTYCQSITELTHVDQDSSIPTGYVTLPIHLNCSFFDVWGNPITQRKPKQTWGEHSNSTQNPEPSCFEATVLTTKPPWHPSSVQASGILRLW